MPTHLLKQTADWHAVCFLSQLCAACAASPSLLSTACARLAGTSQLMPRWRPCWQVGCCAAALVAQACLHLAASELRWHCVGRLAMSLHQLACRRLLLLPCIPNFTVDPSAASRGTSICRHGAMHAPSQAALLSIRHVTITHPAVQASRTASCVSWRVVSRSSWTAVPRLTQSTGR